mgnify:CR=1 FL=1
MFEQIFTTQNIIQGGSVILALYLVYSHIQKDRNIMKIMSNHLEHDLEQREKDNDSRDKLSSTLQKLVDVINNKLK